MTLAWVHHISDRVAVMYLGRIVEIGQRARPFSAKRPILYPSAFEFGTVGQEGAQIFFTIEGDVPQAPPIPPAGVPFSNPLPPLQLRVAKHRSAGEEVGRAFGRGARGGRCHLAQSYVKGPAA